MPEEDERTSKEDKSDSLNDNNDVHQASQDNKRNHRIMFRMEFCGVCDSILRIKQQKGNNTYYCPTCKKFKPWRKIKESSVINVYTNDENRRIEVDKAKNILSICTHCRKEFSNTIGKTTTAEYANEYGEVGATYHTTQNTRFCSNECRNRFMSNY